MNFHILISFFVLLNIYFIDLNINKSKIKKIYFFLILAVTFNFYKNIDRIYENQFINDPIKMVSSKIYNPSQKKIDGYIYYNGWYGNAPIGKKILVNKKHDKKLIFDIISNK